MRFERSVTPRSSLVAISGKSMWCATCGARKHVATNDVLGNSQQRKMRAELQRGARRARNEQMRAGRMRDLAVPVHLKTALLR